VTEPAEQATATETAAEDSAATTEQERYKAILAKYETPSDESAVAAGDAKDEASKAPPAAAAPTGEKSPEEKDLIEWNHALKRKKAALSEAKTKFETEKATLAKDLEQGRAAAKELAELRERVKSDPLSVARALGLDTKALITQQLREDTPEAKAAALEARLDAREKAEAEAAEKAKGESAAAEQKKIEAETRAHHAAFAQHVAFIDPETKDSRYPATASFLELRGAAALEAIADKASERFSEKVRTGELPKPKSAEEYYAAVAKIIEVDAKPFMQELIGKSGKRFGLTDGKAQSANATSRGASPGKQGKADAPSAPTTKTLTADMGATSGGARTETRREREARLFAKWRD
jgi:hypothetical protein